MVDEKRLMEENKSNMEPPFSPAYLDIAKAFSRGSSAG